MIDGAECDWLGQPYVCMTVQTITSIGVYIRDAEAYFAAAEPCRSN